jgi:hypothetical protein
VTRKNRINGKLVDMPLAPRTAQLALTVCAMAFDVRESDRADVRTVRRCGADGNDQPLGNLGVGEPCNM